MTLGERVKNALEATDPSDLDILLSRCYYEGAVTGAVTTCGICNIKIAKMQKIAESMRYHKIAKSFFDFDLSEVEKYKKTVQKRLEECQKADKSGREIPKDVYAADGSVIDNACFTAYIIGRQETAHNISDLYTKQLSKVMEKIREHKYHGMGERIIGMAKPYIYLTDYNMDLSYIYGSAETSLRKDFPKKEISRKEEREELRKNKLHSRSR